MEVSNQYFQFNDGGRVAAGFKGPTKDCVTRAIAIATGKAYQEVYDSLNTLAGKATARQGVDKSVYSAYHNQLGWSWVPLMKFGQGCSVHLTKSELPNGRLIVRVSKHVVAVIDGVVNDTFDCTRGGKRCVYGYFIEENT